MKLKELKSKIDGMIEERGGDINVTYTKGEGFEAIRNVIYCSTCNEVHLLKE